ncbi:MAG: hypothetical protein WAS27_02155 [Candidatus Saccharimonadales bacterium]
MTGPHIDQVPQSQPNNNNRPNTTDKEPQSKNKLIAIAAISSVTAAAAIGVGTYLGIQKKIDDMSEGLNGVIAEAPVVPGETNPANMSLAQFEELSRTEQIDYAGSILNASVKSDTQLVLEQLDLTGWSDYNYFNREVVQPSLSNTPQQILDQLACGFAHVRDVANSDDPNGLNEAKKLAHGVAEGAMYDALLENLGTGDNLTYTEVSNASDENIRPLKTNGSYYDIEANGYPIFSFEKEALGTREYKRTRVVVRFIEGTDDSASRWVIARAKRIVG